MHHRNGVTEKVKITPREHEGICVPHELKHWDKSLPFPKLHFLLSALIVFSLAILCFMNSHDADFVFDDSEAILNNKDLQPDTPILDLFSHDYWGSKLISNASHKSYRPLTVLTFRLNFFLAGGLEPWGFHVTNIFLHGVMCVLLLVVCSILFGGICMNESGCINFGAPKASLLCTILFAIHPIHTESVAGVVGRADLLCAIFFLLSFISYVKTCNTGVTDAQTRPMSFSMPWATFSMFLCTASVFFKEQGITVIGISSAYDIIMVCHIDLAKVLKISSAGQLAYPKSLATNNNGVNSNGVQVNGTKHDGDVNGINGHHKSMSPLCYTSWITSLAYRQAILMLTGIIVLVVRWRVMGSSVPTFQVVDNPHSFANGTIIKAINYNYLYAINSWLMLNPWWLCFDWSMGCIPVITSFTDARILAATAFIFILGTLIRTALLSEQNHCRRLLTMGLALMIVTFLPGANIFFRVGFVIAERVLYLPSIGFCVLITLGVRQLCQKVQYRKFVLWCLIFLVMLFITRSVVRSSEWKTERVLFDSGAKVCPKNAKVHYNIAKIAGDDGDMELAIEKYRLAISLNPKYDQAMNNLANVLKEHGGLLEAEQLLLRAVSIRTEFAAAWMNLGIVQASLDKTAEAEKSYFTAITHRKNYPDCFYNLGNLYLKMGQHEDALSAWRNATYLRPTHSNSWNNMLILLTDLNQVDLAEAFATEAIKHLANDASIYYNLAGCQGKANKFKESEANFLKAIEFNPQNPHYYANLGVLYHRWKKYDKAEKAYLAGLQIDPTAEQTRSNLAMLYRSMGRKT